MSDAGEDSKDNVEINDAETLKDKLMIYLMQEDEE